MKKQLAVFAFTVFAGTMFAQGALRPIAGASIDRNTKLPVYWLAQCQPKDKLTVKAILDDKGKTKAVTFAPTINHLDFFGNAINFEAGDEFTLIVKLKGKGSVEVGYIAYKSDNGYLFSSRSNPITLTGAEQTITMKFTVKDGKNYPTAKIRPNIRVIKGTVCEIYSAVLSEE